MVAGSLLVFASALVVAFAVLSPWPVDIVSRVPEEWRPRLAIAASVMAALTVLLGGALVLTGQMLLLLRDVHRHVARLDGRETTRTRESGRSTDRPDATSRLLPRR